MDGDDGPDGPRKRRKKRKHGFYKGKNFRVIPEAVEALDRVVSHFKNSRTLLMNGLNLTQEAIVCSSWLYMESLPHAEIERLLAPHIARLGEILVEAGDVEQVPQDVRFAAVKSPGVGVKGTLREADKSDKRGVKKRDAI